MTKRRLKLCVLDNVNGGMRWEDWRASENLIDRRDPNSQPNEPPDQAWAPTPPEGGWGAPGSLEDQAGYNDIGANLGGSQPDRQTPDQTPADAPQYDGGDDSEFA